MKNRPLIILLFVVCVAGCSFPWRIVLLNDTGAEIVLNLSTKTLRIEPNSEEEFSYPQEDAAWVLRLYSGGCDYTYNLPRGLPNYPTSKSDPYATTQARIDKNFTISLVMPKFVKTELVDVNDAVLRQDGFPLAPAKKVCR